MYVYDKANELANALKESSEYKAFKTAREKVNANAQSKQMVNDFKKKQFEMQNIQFLGQQPDQEKLGQLQSLYQVIMMNPDISEYLNTEMTFSKVFSDVYKILGDAIELDMDFMQ